MSVIPNPTDCCSVPTGCCIKNLPQNINVTVTTDCGSWSGTIPLVVVSSAGTRVWQGLISGVQCKPNMFSSCQAAIHNFGLVCDGHNFELEAFMYSGLPDPGWTCDPLNMTLSIPLGGSSMCYAPSTITFTE